MAVYRKCHFGTLRLDHPSHAIPKIAVGQPGIHRPFIYASINSGGARFVGRETSEFRHEDITGDRTHCGVCPRRRQRFGGYEQGVQV